MGLRKKAATAAPAEAPAATEEAAPAAPAAAAKKAKPAPKAAAAAAPAAKAKPAKKNAEKPNWLVARLRNSVAKFFENAEAKKAFKEAAKDGSTYEDIKTAADVSEEDWNAFVAGFFNAGGKTPEG